MKCYLKNICSTFSFIFRLWTVSTTSLLSSNLFLNVFNILDNNPIRFFAHAYTTNRLIQSIFVSSGDTTVIGKLMVNLCHFETYLKTFSSWIQKFGIICHKNQYLVAFEVFGFILTSMYWKYIIKTMKLKSNAYSVTPFFDITFLLPSLHLVLP